ncbi:hypothetical protein [Neobacillus bataviensis]|uniref:hypothetical protein n=1 Tax=Neobacillus bataviensis TaxID=220685 RepID=UPI001CC048DC|nr:hypothetical protein [Neobacillus bataviensis]
MYNFNISDLVNEKIKEIEKQSNEAWKFADFKHESFVKRITNHLPFFKHSKQNNCVCACEC